MALAVAWNRSFRSVQTQPVGENSDRVNNYIRFMAIGLGNNLTMAEIANCPCIRQRLGLFLLSILVSEFDNLRFELLGSIWERVTSTYVKVLKLKGDLCAGAQFHARTGTLGPGREISSFHIKPYSTRERWNRICFHRRLNWDVNGGCEIDNLFLKLLVAWRPPLRAGKEIGTESSKEAVAMVG